MLITHAACASTDREPRCPFDIICAIIDFTATDRATLSQIALASRDCCAYANRHLWRECLLTTTMSPASLRERCNALIRDKQRAGCVRRLTMAFRYITERTEDTQRLFDTVAAAAAACAPRLESLGIFGPYHLADVGHALSRLLERPTTHYDSPSSLLPHPMPLDSPDKSNTGKPLFPSLTTISISIVLLSTGSIMPFLVHGCPEVRKWYIGGLGTQKCMANVPYNLFPALEEFEGPLISLKNVTRGRPVRSITVIDTLNAAKEVAVQYLLDGLEASTTPVLELSITASLALAQDVNTVEVRLIRCIQRVAPLLRSLELFSHGGYTSGDCDEAQRRFAEGLAVFQKLEEFKWWDNRGQEWGVTFVNKCFESSKTLRHIVINNKRYTDTTRSERTMPNESLGVLGGISN